jgi:NitT/TauT family transport system ATP-binding protein
VPIDLGSRAGDLRSTPEFSKYRHEIWTLLHDEVKQEVA